MIRRGGQRADQDHDHGHRAVAADGEQVAEQPGEHSPGQADKAVPAVRRDEGAGLGVDHGRGAVAGHHQQRPRGHHRPDEARPPPRAARSRAATARQATTPRRTPAAARAAGSGIGSVILRSSVRDRRRPRAPARTAAAGALRRHGQAPPRASRKIGGAQLLDTLVVAYGVTMSARPSQGEIMIEARDLTKRYGDKLAVDHLSFTVEPGRVTGFLGPERRGQVHHDAADPRPGPPESGPRDDQRPAVHRPGEPLRTVGALLEAQAMHPGRSACNHLLFLAQSQGLPGPGWTRCSTWSG